MDSENEKKKRQSLRNNEYYDMQEIFDELYEKSKNNEEFRKLAEIISSEENILLAYRNIKSNKGRNTPGTDGETIKKYKEMKVEEFIKHFQELIVNYQPKSVKRVLIPKKDGRMRPLGIPCIQDRIIQQCIKQVLDPICEAKFYGHSYGFRQNRSTHDAIARFQCLVNVVGLNYVVDIDVKNFFDNVDHSKLLKQMWTLGIQDKNLLFIIKKILNSEVYGIGIQEKGTPQGGIISPILSNIVLNEMDWWISNQWDTFETSYKYKNKRNRIRRLKASNLKEIYLVRYADDFKILCKNSKTAFKVFNAVKQWLKERLNLDINLDKSKVTNLRKNYTDFLGFKLKARIKKNKKSKPRWICRSHISNKNMINIQNKLLKEIKIIKKNAMSKFVRNLNAVILGIHNYFKIATMVSIDLRRINFNLIRAINKLKPKTKGEHSKTYLKLYAKYGKRKVLKVADVDIFPIYGATNKPAMNFNQERCSYTVKGRLLIHRQIHTVDHLVKHLVMTAKYETTEYSDNRISLLYQQKGRCAITGKNLENGKMDCHHKKLISNGGTDEYKNLVWLESYIHKFIHATRIEVIKTFWNRLLKELNLHIKREFENILNKVNSYRVLAGNFPITLETII